MLSETAICLNEKKPNKTPINRILDAKRLFYVVLVCTVSTNNTGFGFQPEFLEPILNLTVPISRDATFKCLVMHLGGYRVGWVKADTKAIQAIHDHVITHNPRVSVSHDDFTTWKLHIRNVQEEDRGHYMCQINTDPMKSQVGYLDVVTPPDFVGEETSGDIILSEGGTAKLTCRARGYPIPSVTWRREDGQHMVLKEPNGVKNKVTLYEGEILKLSKVTRSDMGAYLCIASNSVPPSISKRIMVNVHFHPIIQVPNQLVGAPLGTDVRLECIIEASPKSINYWIRDTGDMIVASSKYDVQTSVKSLFEAKMYVMIRNFQPDDIGSYHCIAKNSLGEMESTIRLYEIPGPTKAIFPPRFDEEDYNEQYGSAERDLEEELLNQVTGYEKIRHESSTIVTSTTQLLTSRNHRRGNKIHHFDDANELTTTHNKIRFEFSTTEHTPSTETYAKSIASLRSNLVTVTFFNFLRLLLIG